MKSLRWLSRSAGFIALLAGTTLAQAQQTGLGLWTGAGVDVRLSRQFGVELEAQTRFSENVSVLRSYLGEVGLSYRPDKHWRVSGFYRYTGRRRFNDDDEVYFYRVFHRFYGEAAYDRKVGKHLKAAYRLRYQNQFRDDAEGLVASNSYWRNKLELGWSNDSRFTPYVSADVFNRVGTGFEQVRLRAGVDIDLTKTQRLGLSAFSDRSLTPDQRSSGLILGVMYQARVNLYLKKE